MNRYDYPYIAPYAAFLALAVKTAEMLLASGQVIRHRVGRMATAGVSPSAADRREFMRMGTEKVVAAGASSTAMAMHMLENNMKLAEQLCEAQWRMAAACMSLATSASPAQLMKRQTRMHSTLRQHPLRTHDWPRTTLKLVSSGMGPIHARALANSRRLGKR